MSLRILKFAATVLLVIGYGALSACQAAQPSLETANTSAAPSTSTSAALSTSLKVVTLPFVTFAPYYIALQEGYFEEQGLEVELVDMRRQEEILPALSSSQVDVSSGLLSAGILNTIARGGNIKITADKGYVDPAGCVNWAIIGRQDLIESGQLQTPDQIAGMTVNIVPATWLEYYLAKVLAQGGLTLDDIVKVNVTTAAVPEAFAAKEIAANPNGEPWATILARSGHLPVFDLPQTVLPDESGAVQIYGPNLLGENSDIGVRFMTAYLQGVRQYQEGPTERNVELVAEFTELDPALLETMCWPPIRPSGEVNLDGVLAFQEWANEAGYMEEILPVETFYDGSFIEQANARLNGGS